MTEPELHLHGDVVVPDIAIYAREGVRRYWIVDPLNYVLEVKRVADGAYSDAAIFGRDDTLIRAEPFDAVELDLSQWWLPEAPAP